MNKKLIPLLTYSNSRWWSTKRGARRKHIIKGLTCIENRPKHIEEKKEVGH